MDTGVQPRYKLEVLVSDPQKRSNESGSPYVSYQISTRTDNPQYHGSQKANFDDIIVVHRRYNDVVLLHDILLNDHPTCIIPPLPDKKVLQYIAGDRFGRRFTERRCHSLQNFLRRVSLHPVLSESKVLEMFLVSNEWETYKKNLSGTLQNVQKEDVTDAVMNAFKKVHNQNDEFVEIKDKTDKLDHSVHKINKVFHRVVKKNENIVEDYSKLGLSLQELQELVCNDNDKLADELKMFVEGITQLSYGLQDLNKFIDYEYLVDLKDLEHYIDSMKQTIKLKDQKQIDYEELSDYLTKSVKEKNNLISGYGGGNFLTSKIEELAGYNQEASRREKINKLESTISSLTNELEIARKVADSFEQETLKEVKQFEQIKNDEMRDSLNNLADQHIKFYEKMLETWVQVDESLK
ncbi:Sorting nexin-4 [Nakaseomyces bracarensis]|uniref:Sorting nexin-4 n=1 Tax=Nakaseomyces bracarensis TaxID=273131 RepID=A0ABR4P0U4_9SACH